MSISYEKKMSRLCELSGVGVMSGNKVSHSQRKTKRKFLPNLRRVSLTSELLGLEYKFRITARALRSVEVHGGLDGYLLNTKDTVLSGEALSVKKTIKNLLTKN